MSRIEDYADAVLAVGRAERSVGRIESDLHAFAEAIAASAELQNTLGDATIPAVRRQQVVEDVLGGKAGRASVAAISMLVGAGCSDELGEIARALSSKVAGERGAAYAEVRSAVPLSDEQKQRLAAALSESVGRPVDVRVTIDPSVVGGLVTQIDDTVIDGSLRRRLNQMRETLV